MNLYEPIVMNTNFIRAHVQNETTKGPQDRPEKPKQMQRRLAHFKVQVTIHRFKIKFMRPINK